jgi:O-acetyl-ADP-ribose deacetylase (regulator of RNase III)
MRMSRFEEYSVSAIIRYLGARRDAAGYVVQDTIAEDLSQQLAGWTSVAPGTAVVTGSGELARSNGVRLIVHVAAVQGEPGEGYRVVRDVGQCVTNALRRLEDLNVGSTEEAPVRSALFPLLGTGEGGGDLITTVPALLGAALDHLGSVPEPTVRTVYCLAYTEQELRVCRDVFDSNSRLTRIPTGDARPA